MGQKNVDAPLSNALDQLMEQHGICMKERWRPSMVREYAHIRTELAYLYDWPDNVTGVELADKSTET